MLNTPILFLVFNRPDETQQVFESIRNIKPKKLFIAADGSRLNVSEDKINCELVKRIVSHIDWDCELKTLYREQNLGCGLAVSSAISWFFENVEQGIILEDDCLPDPSFYEYCQLMLNRYKNDQEVMSISGQNFQGGISRGDGTYYFSKYSHIWGWATWKDAWKFYDFKIKSWPEFEKVSLMKICNNDETQYRYWSDIAKMMIECKIDTWDYQWMFSIWMNNGINILPNKNLIENIGFTNNATHTKDSNSVYSNMSRYVYDEDIIPSEKKIESLADDFTFYTVYNPPAKNVNKRKFNIKRVFRMLIPYKVKLILKRIMNKHA